MRIQNNITAMNTHRQYTINNDNVAKNAEKLSSGYRINRAGDDAAGLAISEKMRSQIRGLNMATKNSQDAISLVQTAEGALQETHAMLQRMNELAVQAATGTNQESDRMALAKEFEQLKREINDVAEQTTFNNMKILDGSLSYKGYERSAATAGVNVTRPTNFENASTAPVGGTATASIASDLTKTLGAGSKLTLEFQVGTATKAAGDSTTIKFESREAKAGETVKDLIKDGFKGVENADGYSVEVKDDGTVTLTSTKDDLSGKTITMKMTSSGGEQLDAATAKPMQVAGVNDSNTPSEGKAPVIRLSGLGSESVWDSTSSGSAKPVATQIKVGDETWDIEISVSTASATAATLEDAAAEDGAKITVSIKSGGKDVEGWSGTYESDGTLVLTGQAPKTDADKLDTSKVEMVSGKPGTLESTEAGEVAGKSTDATRDVQMARDISSRAGAGDPSGITATAGFDVTSTSLRKGDIAALEVTLPGGEKLRFESEAVGDTNKSYVDTLNGLKATDKAGNEFTLTVNADKSIAINGPAKEVFTDTDKSNYSISMGYTSSAGGAINSGGSVTVDTVVAGTAPVEDKPAADSAQAQTVKGTVSNEVKSAQVAAGKTATFTVETKDAEGKDVTLTFTKDNTSSDAVDFTTLMNGAKADPVAKADSTGNVTLGMNADGSFTITDPTGKLSTNPADYKVTANDGTNAIANAGTVTDAGGADKTEATGPKDTGLVAEAGDPVKADDVTTIEFDFNKLEVGDQVDIMIGDKTVSITRTEGMDRDAFIKELEAKTAGMDGVKVSGTAIVVTGQSVGEPVLKMDALGNTKTNAMRIQVGALENEQLNISIDSMNTKGLGLDGMSLTDQDAAGKAITAVRNAVLKVADQRATLGAMQNRLDHKIANLKVTSENLSAAESRIRDVDMASEMTQFTKNNILSQAATAMLAQANSLPQNVLSLLG